MHPEHFAVKEMGQMFPVMAALGQMGEGQIRLDPAPAQQIQEMGHERHVAPETDLLRHIPLGKG